MFTGIVTGMGTISSLVKEGDLEATIMTPFTEIALKGQSIACSGVCLTVIEAGKVENSSLSWFRVSISEETLTKTTAKYWQAQTKINLEKALCLGDELGGHLVSGHIDGVGRICSINEVEGSHECRIRMEPNLLAYMAKKGSVAIDGVSLTINQVYESEISLNIIPFTWNHTLFHTYQINTQVNIEIDLIARYVARLLQK